MNTYKKDFEKAIEMIDWQTEMLKKQATRIGELEKRLKEEFDYAEKLLKERE